MTANIPDGNYQFGDSSGHVVEGNFRNGVPDGVWRIFDARNHRLLFQITWSLGEWHGHSVSWWSDDTKKEEGNYSHGQMDGEWSFWFSNGQLAARGSYHADRKIGDWRYFNEEGQPLDKHFWEVEFEDWDFAWDDYTGAPRGENWPLPPDHSVLK